MATAQVEAQRLLIGGEWRDAGGGGSFETTDPFTGEPAGTSAAAKREDARAAADAAAQAFGPWASTPPVVRRELLQKASALLMERDCLTAERMQVHPDQSAVTAKACGCSPASQRCHIWV